MSIIDDLFGGGTSSQSTQSTQPSSQSITTSNIPDWAVEYATKNLGKAANLTDINQNPYQTYAGNRVADFNPLQNQAFTNVAGMTTNTGTGNAMNQTQDMYNQSANAGPYNAQNFGNQYGQGPQFQNMGLGYLATNAQDFGQQDAQKYMSPYQQNVTDFQKQEAVKDYSRALPGMGAQASGAGAFGGTRHALVAAEGQRNLQNQLGGIQAIGSQNAYQNAQQQFNADQARQMQAQFANQGAYGQMQGLGMQQNLAGNQQAMQNAAQRAQYGLAGQQAGEASRQFGANYGLQNRQQALGAAAQLGALGQQQYGQQMGINTAQQQAGAQMQAQEQQGLSNKYQDFLNQQNYPYKQLAFMSEQIRGTPTFAGAQSMYQAPPSGVSQASGLLGGLGSLFGAYNTANRGAAGGDVRGYAEGGIVGLADGGPTSAAELMTAKNINAGKSTLDQELGLGADLRRLLMASMQLKELETRKSILELQAQIQNATGMPSQQNTTVAADVSNMLRQEVENSAAENAPERQGGIADLDTGNLGENYNSGGIVAFDDGGNVRHFQTGSPGVVYGGYDPDNPEHVRTGGPYADLVAPRKKEPEQLTRSEVRAAMGLDYVPEPTPTAAAPTAVPVPAASQADARKADNAAAAAAPAAVPRVPIYGANPAAAAESEDSGYTKLMTTLQGNADEGLRLLKKGIQPREANKTAGEHAAALREQDNAYLKARGLPTAEESMKERVDNLATAGKEARNNRDVDRWMAVAQGFFAMAGGKSQYAMQNMAEGLNMGVKELRAVEQDYRKVDQLQKDKAELLKEATRQEARGDFAKGDALRKEIDDRNTKIDATNLTIGERMTAHAGTAMGNAISAKAATDARRDAAAGRTAEARYRSDVLEESKRQSQEETKRRNEETERQKYATFQLAAKKGHRLNQKGGPLDTALGELEIVQSKLAAKGKSKDPDLLTQEAALETRIGKHNDTIANESAAEASRMINAGSKFKYVGVQ